LGAESIGEYKAIFQKLGGTRTNRMFEAFGIAAHCCHQAPGSQGEPKEESRKPNR
jgi:hypothetical protein